MNHSPYDDRKHVQQMIAEGRHRDFVGGHWDDLGRLQLDFLIGRGLRPDSVLVDIGCGALRLGALATAYLDPGRYFGFDQNEGLIEVGWLQELTPDLQARCPRSNLWRSDDFDFSPLPQRADFGIAQSVFTHLPLNHLRRCLRRAADHFRAGGVIYLTAFLLSDACDISAPYVWPRGGVTSFEDRNPYHYWRRDFDYAALDAGWSIEVIGDWGHPRDQQMIAARRSA